MSARGAIALALLAALSSSVTEGCNTSRAQTHEGHGAASTTPAPPSGKPSEEHNDHAAPATSGVPSGYAAVMIEPASAKAIGLTTAKVEERDFLRQLRTTGVVVVDETRTAHVHAKVRGWVDGITVNFVGQRVSAGQVLCGIYSQEVYAAEIEYLALLGRVRADLPPRGEFADQERQAREELIAAARRRLGLWDVPKAEIERLEATREARRTFPLVAPRSGIVVSKQVLDGTSVDPSSELYTISDLSRVWVLADVYEGDVASMHIGQPARLDVQGAAGPIDAKVAFVPPTIDQPTRTLKVRFDLTNARQQLRPGAFATVNMALALGRGLAVPESAVVRTGTRAIVFVVHDEKHVSPREVTLGPLVENLYRVEAGLSAGDVVATGAQFLLDSETRLRASSGAGAGHGAH